MSDERFKKFGSPEDCLIEECAELIHIISKGKRFGWGSYHPDKIQDNAELTLLEMDDVERRINELRPILRTFIENQKMREPK